MFNNEALNTSAAATARTDLAIYARGELMEAMTDVGPEDCGPQIAVAFLMANIGFPVELVFSNPDVHAIFAQLNEPGRVPANIDIKVTLKGAASKAA